MPAEGPGGRHGLRLAAGASIGVGLLTALVLSRLGLSAVTEWIGNTTHWAASAGPAGWALFVLAQAMVAMIGIVPASLLGVAAGGFYGTMLGFPLAAAGTMIGGWLAFKLARSLLRPWVERLLSRRVNGRLAHLDRAVTRDGWRFVCLLRVSPIMPFALTSYALGLSDISERHYVLGTIASLPALAGYVSVGAIARFGAAAAAGSEPRGMLQWVLLAIGVGATAVLILRSGALMARCGLLPGSRLPANADRN